MDCKPIITLCLFAAMAAPREMRAQPNDQFAVLPQIQGMQLALCSRPGPKVAGSWDPTVGDVLDLESHLKEIANLKARGAINGAQIAHPEAFLRQYLGVIVQGRQMIYVNAFPKGVDPGNWRKKFVTICDGGVSVWGVLYDPQTHAFSELETNGRA